MNANFNKLKCTGALLFSVLIVSCSSPEKSDLETKKAELEKYQAELNQLQAKVAALESEIEQMDTTSAGKNGVLVEIAEIQPKVFEHTFEVNGTIEADKNITMSSEAAGQLKRIFVKEGDKVSVGEVLAVLNTETLESGLEEVKTGLELATTVFNRQKKLWEQNIGSEIQYLQAKNNKEALEKKLQTLKSQLALATTKSPVNGVVETIFRKEGELVVPGTPLIQVVNLDKVKIVAEVPENVVKNVKTGDKVNVKFPTLGVEDKVLSITRTGNVINPKNRTFKIELQAENKDDMLKPNALSVVQVSDYKADSALVVPSIIINKDSKGSYLYTLSASAKGKQIARKTYIKTGKSNDGNTMVKEGLLLNDKIIVAGYNEVADGTEVRLKTE